MTLTRNSIHLLIIFIACSVLPQIGFAKVPVPLNDEVELYSNCGLKGRLSLDVFIEAYRGMIKYHPARTVIAIADFNLPSNQQRLFIVDLKNHKLLLQTYVAHGKNSGDLMANSFSNENESHKSSCGFFMVGAKIKSPKHGDALLLEGLQKGINDHARAREIIIHSAGYVSDDFIRTHGRLGRSYGCPAVSAAALSDVINYLEGGSLLYIHTAGKA